MKWPWDGRKNPESANTKEENLTHNATVEFVKSAKKHTAEKADEANATIDKLNQLLIENGITLKIIIAAGGHGRDGR
jgi:hypothetical protein